MIVRSRRTVCAFTAKSRALTIDHVVFFNLGETALPTACKRLTSITPISAETFGSSLEEGLVTCPARQARLDRSRLSEEPPCAAPVRSGLAHPLMSWYCLRPSLVRRILL